MRMNTNAGYSSILLECLRENAANMRRENQDLADRIAIALEKSRANLQNVENINLQLQKMKVSINDALNNVRGLEATDGVKVACQNLLDHLFGMVDKSEIKKAASNASEEAVALSIKAPIEEHAPEDNIDAAKPLN